MILKENGFEIEIFPTHAVEKDVLNLTIDTPAGVCMDILIKSDGTIIYDGFEFKKPKGGVEAAIAKVLDEADQGTEKVLDIELISKTIKCPVCHGSGGECGTGDNMDVYPCYKCDGHGVITKGK